MKNFLLIICFIFSLSVKADSASVYPQVINFGSSVQVSVWNTSNQNVNCSGWIYITTGNGSRQSEYYYENVWAGSSSYRNFYLRDFQDRVLYTTHTIQCF